MVGMLTIQNHFILFVVDDPAACRDFYRRHLGFDVEFDIGWYALLKSGGAAPFGIGFLQSDHPSQPSHHRKPVSGARFVSLEVPDVDAVAQRLMAEGVGVDIPLRDEPWGQRHIIVLDPAGNGVDLITPIEPDPEFVAKWIGVS